MAQKTYGIDFGTGTIKIYKKGNGIVILERNVVSTVGKENKPIAIGETAYEMKMADCIMWGSLSVVTVLMKCMKKNRQAFMFLFHCSMA